MKKAEIMILIYSEMKVNVINFAYAINLGPQIQKINVSAQKINDFFLKIYNMIIVIFQILNRLCCICFF